MPQPQKFSPALLHPRYWLTWFGLGVLWLLVHLPYPVLRRLGGLLGRMSKTFLKRRVSIARRNLELCFPDMDRIRLEDTVNSNFTSLGMGLLGMGL
ncbi:kdo(2)-lipid IV(A) palmitoleoyltransferase, partial [Sodalis-like symbiont of Bactericera trigonica]